MEKRMFETVHSYMCECMSDSAHDKEHIYRVLNNALVIAQNENAVDYDILICACLLHDIGRIDQIHNPELCHAQVGSEKAYAFLTEIGCTEAFSKHVRDCIRTHRFRRDDTPESLEARILFDADKLDVVGAIGIARTLVYKGTVTEPLYTRRQDGTISNGNGDENPSFFQEYHRKLTKLYDRFYTRRGAELARERQFAAVSFYENIYTEVNRFDIQGRNRLFELLK